MPAYYTYLISSLPALTFGLKLPFSLKEFFEVCSRAIPEDDLAKIKQEVNSPAYKLKGLKNEALKRWHIFDFSLRNELARSRAARKKKDPLKYLRGDIYAQPDITHIAMSAYRNTNILEAEKSLDLERWRFLDELSIGHYFDITFLIVYALKLKILIRWDKINNADRPALVKETLSSYA